MTAKRPRKARRAVRRWAWAFAAGLIVSAGAARAGEPNEPPPSPAAATAGDLLNQFRRNRDLETRKRLTAQLIEMGGTAPSRLLMAINAELQPLRSRYGPAYLKQTVLLLEGRLATGAETIRTQRKTVLDLLGNNRLTSEMIRAKADPALAQLEKILIVERETVLKEAPSLREERERLLALGELWQQCTDWLAKQNPGGNPEKAENFKASLESEETLTALLVAAPDDEVRNVLMENVRLESQIPVEEARGLRRLNRVRLVLGLRPLLIDPHLCEAARDHSKDMATKGFFGHESPVPGKTTLVDRAKRFGTTARGENIAGGTTSGEEVIMKWWWYSPGHLKNMMGDYARVGLGGYETTWTLLFG